MTKQEIIDSIYDLAEEYFINDLRRANPINKTNVNELADMFLAIIEQEKKEVVREIFEKLYPCISRGAVTYTIWAKDIEEIAKEYEVKYEKNEI